MLKAKGKLRQLPPNAKPDDYFVDGLLQHYEKRVVPEDSPHAHAIADMSLASFAAWYKKSGSKSTPQDEEGEGEGGEESDILGVDEGATLPPTIHLGGDEGGVMVRRRRKAVVRYHRFDPKKDDGEEFFYSVLVLFYPFQTENELELAKSGFPTYKSFFEAKQANIQPLLAEFESYSGPIALAFDEMQKARQEALERRLAANEEDGGEEERQADQPQDGDLAFLDPDDLVLDVLDGVAGVGEDGDGDDQASPDVQGFKVQASLGLSKEEILAELSSIEAQLNSDQMKAYGAARGRVQIYKECRRLGKTYGESPLFISGPGGTGKSFLLRAIKLRIHLELHDDLEDLTSVTMAPTGTSALNVDGDTIHHALSLPIQQHRAFVQSYLSDKKLQELKNKYATTHAWLIDEVSMISSNSIYHINERLNAIAGVTDPSVFFGGMILIYFGDLAQLQPVCAPRPYANPSAKVTGAGGAAIHLWRDLVEMVELTIVERQKGDQAWAELLTRIRDNRHTDEDEATLKTRLLSELNLDPASPAIRDLPHLFHTNADVDSFNDAKLTALVKDKEAQLTREGLEPSSASLQLLAHDDFDGQSNMNKAKYKGDFAQLLPKSRNETGGLPSELRLCLGARIMLKRNINVEDGLVNGSTGKVAGWHRNCRDGLPLCVYVQFDKVNGKLVGRKTRKELKKYMMEDMPSSYVPLLPSTVTFKGANKSRFTIRRQMFPLCLAWALTVHSCQGMTLARAVLDLGSTCMPCAIAYVGLSRVVSMEGLFLLRFHPNAIRCDARALREMERLRAFSNKDAATDNAACAATEDTEQSTERVDSGEKPRSSPTKQYSRGKKKAIATLEKLSAAVKDAGKSLGRSMGVLPSLANSGFESLGP